MMRLEVGKLYRFVPPYAAKYVNEVNFCANEIIMFVGYNPGMRTNKRNITFNSDSWYYSFLRLDGTMFDEHAIGFWRIEKDLHRIKL